MYKGAVKKGSTISAELSCAPSSKGTAQLTIAYANDAGGTGSPHVIVAPGGTNTVEFTTAGDAQGTLRVWADLNDDRDSGTLSVRVDGTEIDTASIIGDVSWSYSVL
jgi:hypothetical protein